ncbi:MAG: hypothetical protein HN849_06245 [Victivallales bacterium]|jgi:hypothetical protein|nr:hypothetical protein [Victivallales bacterium]MBT7299089.1 hypothetical protein [Victivallales bacterium]
MSAPAVELVLVHRHPPCKKCLKAKATMEEAAVESGVATTFKEIFIGTPEAAPYGAVASPMVMINGKTASAGFAPLKSALVNAIRKEAEA